MDDIEKKADLFSAIGSGDVQTIEQCILRSEVPPNVRNFVDRTPLHMICDVEDSPKIELTDRLSILKLLWECGANVNVKDGKLNESALHLAVKSQLVEVVQLLLSFGANYDSRNRNEQTALHLAAGLKDSGERSKSVAELLLQRGVNFHAQDKRYKSPLIQAVCSDNDEVLLLLLKAGARVDFVNRKGLTALFYACEEENVRMAQLLLDHGANVNFRESGRKSSPLHFVVGGTHKRARAGRSASGGGEPAKIARLLLQKGADVDARDLDGLTALHLAAEMLDEELVDALLDFEAATDAKDDYGNTPLHVLMVTHHDASRERTRSRLARLLLFKGANVNELNNNLETPFHFSLRLGVCDNVSFFLENGADTRNLWCSKNSNFSFLHDNPKCNTPLICGNDTEEAFTTFNVAVALGHAQVVDFLLDYSSSDEREASNFTGSHGIMKTPLYFAVKNGHYEVTKLLLDAGCRINRSILHDTTVLHEAVNHRTRTDILYLLLEYGANVDAKDFFGRTPLFYAIESDENLSIQQNSHILVMEYVKLELRNFKTIHQDLQLIISNTWLADFRLKCVLELSTMEKDFLWDNLTVFSILSKNIDSLATCLNNENIVSTFKSKDFEKKYPIYNKMLNIHFDLALEKKEILDVTVEFLNEILRPIMGSLNFLTLPETIIYKILNYCSTRDLKKMTLYF